MSFQLSAPLNTAAIAISRISSSKCSRFRSTRGSRNSAKYFRGFSISPSHLAKRLPHIAIYMRQPCLVAWTHARIPHPLHEALFHGCLVGLVGFSAGVEEPSRQLRLRGDARTPAIHHLLCLLHQDFTRALQCVLVLFAEARGLLDLPQLGKRSRRSSLSGGSVV